MIKWIDKGIYIYRERERDRETERERFFEAAIESWP